MKRTIAVILVLMLGLTLLAGCGGTKLSGKYELISVTEDGETEMWADVVKEMKEYNENMKEMLEEYEELDESAYESYLEFIDGEKCKLIFWGEVGEGTYKIDGKNIEMTIDEETYKGTIDGKKITIDMDEVSTMLFEQK